MRSPEVYFVRFVLFCADVVNDLLSKNCPYVAGAISFYTLFSLFPLVLALISVTGFFLGPSANRHQLAEDIAPATYGQFFERKSLTTSAQKSTNLTKYTSGLRNQLLRFQGECTGLFVEANLCVRPRGQTHRSAPTIMAYTHIENAIVSELLPNNSVWECPDSGR